MLSGAPLIGFIPVTDVEVARTFYESQLGLAVVESTPFALVIDAHGTMLRITPVPELQPQPFTIVGWAVEDIEATVNAMTDVGVAFNRYEGMRQDPSGIWNTPTGDKIAWFRDPDGNTLSLTQFAVA